VLPSCLAMCGRPPALSYMRFKYASPPSSLRCAQLAVSWCAAAKA
jgi:hypothetical protein